MAIVTMEDEYELVGGPLNVAISYDLEFTSQCSSTSSNSKMVHIEPYLQRQPQEGLRLGLINKSVALILS